MHLQYETKLQRVVGTVQYCMLKNTIHDNNFDIRD